MKRYKETVSIAINNQDSSLLAIEEGIKFLYQKYGEDLRFEKMVAFGIYRGLSNCPDIKSSTLLINKYVKEFVNKNA